MLCLTTTSKPITRRLALLLAAVVTVTVEVPLIIHSFVIQHQALPNSKRNIQVSLKDDLFADISVPIRLTDGAHTSVIAAPTEKGSQVKDKNGNELTENAIVRVSMNGIKAYQVNSKGQGHFNDKKEFVPDKSDSKKKCLQLPIGLCGVVKRVYDEDVISSNLPILVVFNPGEHTQEGYDAPTKFLMHFTPSEVEVVV